MALYRSWVYLLPKSLYLRDQMSTIIWSRINLSNPYLNLFFHFWELADDDHFWPQVFFTFQNLVTSFFDSSKFGDKFFWLVKIWWQVFLTHQNLVTSFVYLSKFVYFARYCHTCPDWKNLHRRSEKLTSLGIIMVPFSPSMP